MMMMAKLQAKLIGLKTDHFYKNKIGGQVMTILVSLTQNIRSPYFLNTCLQ
jgi:hypothetical protein